jgi:hemerythrin-like metal-binding protein
MEEARFLVYQLGHFLIDNEHYGMLSEMESAKLAALEHSEASLQESLSKIIELAETHFSHEESVMDERKYPYAEWHKKVHGFILKDLRALNTKFIVIGDKVYAERFFSEAMERLIVKHIDDTDRQLVEWLAENKH